MEQLCYTACQVVIPLNKHMEKNPTQNEKEIFGLSGKEEILARFEAEDEDVEVFYEDSFAGAIEALRYLSDSVKKYDIKGMELAAITVREASNYLELLTIKGKNTKK